MYEVKSGPDNRIPGPMVLAVDDDPGILKIIEVALGRNGYTVQTAPNGEAALEILRKIMPAVLILDVRMPGLTGFQLSERLKQDERYEKLPVLFLTAEGTPQDYKTGYKAGAVVYMVKPFSPDRLLKTVQMLAPIPSL
jgi:DNA-binding response OmpR family regulator